MVGLSLNRLTRNEPGANFPGMTDRPDLDDSGKQKDDLPDWRLKIDCTPEELAQAIFATAKPPDPVAEKAQPAR